MSIQCKTKRCSYRVVLFLAVFHLPCALVIATTANDTNSINSAGVHFSWVIFNRLKPVLENKTGRTIQWYGKTFHNIAGDYDLLLLNRKK